MLHSVFNFYRIPSNLIDHMGERASALDAWRPMHPPNLGPSSNTGLHIMRPPLIPKSDDMDMALSMNAVSIDLIILQNVAQK